VATPAATTTATATATSLATPVTLEPLTRSAIVSHHPTISTHVGCPLPALRTLQAEELAAQWPNVRVEEHDQAVARFLQGGRRPQHPLHVLLARYREARLRLDGTRAQLQQLQANVVALSGDVWAFEKMIVTGSGRCGHGNTVSQKVTQEVAMFQPEHKARLQRALDELRLTVFNEEAEVAYRSELARLGVEHYLARLLARCKAERPPPMASLREALDVLFHFVRAAGTAGGDDRGFASAVQGWARVALHTLVSLGNLDDHYFCLNHVLRVRNGQGAGLAAFVRFPPCDIWDDALFRHVFSMLHTIVSPAPSFPGEELPPTDSLPQPPGGSDAPSPAHASASDPTLSSSPPTQPPHRLTSDASAEWMMVDDDGRAAVNAKTYVHSLSDDDCVALLEKVPLASLLAYVFKVRGAAMAGDGEAGYSAATVHRLFAFGRIFIRTLGAVFHDERRRHLRHFLKRVAYAVVTCVRTMAEYLLQLQDYIRSNGVSLEALPQVQAEYDEVLFDAMVVLDAAAVLEERSFQAMLPFDTASLRCAWRMVAFLHGGANPAMAAAREAASHCNTEGRPIDAAHEAVAQAAEVARHTADDILGLRPAEGWRNYVRSAGARDKLAHHLASQPFGAAQHLFTLLSRLATSRPRGDDIAPPPPAPLTPEKEAAEEQALISAVAMEILFFACVERRTREGCHRDGRDRLDELASGHPEIISLVITFLSSHVEAIGPPGEYILNGLHLEHWVPTRTDLTILKKWLLKPLAALENKMALTLLQHMAWSARTPTQGAAHPADERADAPFGGHTLFLPKELQREVALILLEAYAHHVPKNGVGLLQWLAGAGARDRFVATCWQTLAQMQIWGAPLYSGTTHPRLWPLREHRTSEVTSFLTLAMSDTAQGRLRFLSSLDLLASLSAASLHVAVVKALFFATPAFAFGGEEALTLLKSDGARPLYSVVQACIAPVGAAASALNTLLSHSRLSSFLLRQATPCPALLGDMILFQIRHASALFMALPSRFVP
jgi:hypothetical protein